MVLVKARVGETALRSDQICRAVLIDLLVVGIVTVAEPVNTVAGVKLLLFLLP
jgi:hypothetical protein